MDKSYVVICLGTAVLRIKKELPVSEYKDRSYIVTRYRHVVVVSLISYSYSDLSAAYLGITILYFHNLLAAYLGIIIL